MAPKAKPRPRSKSAPKAKAKPTAKAGARESSRGGGRSDAASPAERDPQTVRSENLLRECLAEPEVAKTDGRVLDIALREARLLKSVESDLLQRAEKRLEDWREFEAELKRRADVLRARKEAAMARHFEENQAFAASLCARRESKNRAEAIFDAVNDGDLEKVQKSLQPTGISPAPPLPVDVEDHEGNTPLSEAACYGEAEVAEWLLEQGAHIDAQNGKGRTPIWRACYNGHVEIAKLLLTRGADPAIPSHGGDFAASQGTPATRAAISGWDVAAVQQARQELSDLQKLPQPWPRQLHEACRSGDTASASELLRAIRPEAAEVGGMVNLLRTVIDMDQAADALWTACCFGHLEVGKALLLAGGDVDSCNESGLTCLMIACRKGHAAVAEELLASGARTYLRSRQGLLAMEYAREAEGEVATRICGMLLKHCRQHEDWSTLEMDARRAPDLDDDPTVSSMNPIKSAEATAQLKAMSTQEMREGSDRYKQLLEERALADVLGLG